MIDHELRNVANRMAKRAIVLLSAEIETMRFLGVPAHSVMLAEAKLHALKWVHDFWTNNPDAELTRSPEELVQEYIDARTVPTACWKCGEEGRVMPPQDDSPMENICLCERCAALSVFDAKANTYVEPTDEQRIDLLQREPLIASEQAAMVAAMKEGDNVH